MIEFSKDMCDYWEPPKWINENYIQDVLRNSFKNDSLTVKKIFIKPAVGKGEHYASCMYRLKITYSTNTKKTSDISLIVKTHSLDESAREILSGYKIYNQEMMMYHKFLPEFQLIFRSSNLKCDLAPNALKINFNENSIVFQDLNELGYEMAPRTNGLDRKHAQLVIEKLAKLHAVSVVYNENNQKNLSNYFKRGMFNRECDTFNPYFLTNLHYLTEEVNRWEGWEYYAKKLVLLKNRLIKNAQNVFDPKEENFNVLCHGDIWVNNAMFKYNENREPIDALMVDFQFPVWGSPAIDILYFMATSLSDDLRAYAQDEFIQFYHTCLVKSFHQLNYKGHIPTLHRIQLEFFKNYFYSFSSTCLVLPVMMSKHSCGIDITTLNGSSDYSPIYKKKIYEDENFQKILKRSLPFFDKKGVLDM